ncbi:MAG: uncharacterized protein JWN98_990 [Abditibacteriota bacterium]|nr:uncharacterized protein [Abditibacteriota bacterium]
MQCPICHTELHMSERHGIEIDYCPTCRGIWLDRGEMDKIIERASREMTSEIGATRAEWSSTPPAHNPAPPPPVSPQIPPQMPPQMPRPVRYDEDDYRRQQSGYGHHSGHNQHYGHKKKKKNFLEDLFDFD